MGPRFRAVQTWLRTRTVELGLGIRVTAASLISLAVAMALQLKLPLWAVLTAIIVTQMSVGRSLKTTRDYLIGTLGGAVYGAAVALSVPHTGEGPLLFVLVLVVLPLAFIAALNPAYNSATVTAIIVLLLPVMNRGDPLESAIDRVLEVTVGALAGLLTSFLVLPSRAHNQIRSGVAKVLGLMADVLDEFLARSSQTRDVNSLHRLQDGIGGALAGLNTLGAEAERERAAHLSSGPETGPLLRTTLRLRHDLVMIGRANLTPLPDAIQARLAAPLAAVSSAIGGYLRQAAMALRDGAKAPDITIVETALGHYAEQIAHVRAEGLTRGLASEAAERVFALGFSLEQMRQNLLDLDRCIGEWNGTKADKKR
ncbi:membrane protein [Afipia sp. P52-10]|uniref:FUSC family protein n=1 Tax=Afipia sp. P52-10 TaxID=1429916 RepID=UPI0003DF284F|nr:FUSC family protein [Afipia sp. P52-10]ETR76370.1 membrane protein [Afipia sp. P52-10]